MSDALDEGLVQRIDARGTTPWSGTCYRYTTAHRDALSGEGARRFGGRWNPPLLFPAIYLADSAKACMVEVERAANAASTTAIKMLEAAYRLHHIQVEELNVLDLRTPDLETPSVSTTTTSTVTTGPPAKQSDTPPGSCTCKGSWSPLPAASALSSRPMNSELAQDNCISRTAKPHPGALHPIPLQLTPRCPAARVRSTDSALLSIARTLLATERHAGCIARIMLLSRQKLPC